MHTHHIKFSWSALKALQEQPVEITLGDGVQFLGHHLCVSLQDLPPFRTVRDWLYDSRIAYHLYGCGSPMILGIAFGFDDLIDLQRFTDWLA